MKSDLYLELGQIKLRFFLVIFVSIYIFVITLFPESPFRSREPDFVRSAITYLFIFNIVLSSIFYLWLRNAPFLLMIGRRMLSCAVDIIAVSSVMYAGDEWGAAIYPVFIWIIFGYALRFGIPYMILSTLFALIGFSFVIYSTPFWSQHISVSIGFLIGLLILPGYFGALLAQKNNAIATKERFLANVSHELRTPLHSIISLSELATKVSDLEKIHQYMQKVNTAGNHLLKIINDILDSAQLANNQVYLSIRSFNLQNLVSDIRNILQPGLLERNIEFTVDIDPAIPETLQSDELKLKQILINLLSNSIKFTEQGQIKLRITQEEKNKNHVRIRFSISDTGIGIKHDSIKKIFDGFIQADNSITRKYGGTGLGLSISKSLVEKLGGELHAESMEQQGSEFWFTLKMPVNSPAMRETSPVTETTDINATANNKHLLIVEDEPVTQDIYRELFSMAGYSPCIVASGREALTKLDESAFSSLIVDHNMPDMSGLELLKLLRQRFSADELPVISVTADASASCRESYQGLSNMHLTKPVSPAILLNAVNKLTGTVPTLAS